MPKKNTTKKAKKQNKTTKKSHNQSVKGKKNNANQNNISIRIGGKGKDLHNPAPVSGSSFGYPVYIQSPLMQPTAPAQPAFGAAAPVATNPISNPTYDIPQRVATNPLYNPVHQPISVQESVNDDMSTLSSLTDYTNADSHMRRYNQNKLSNPYEESSQSLVPYSIDDSQKTAIMSEPNIESGGLSNPYDSTDNTLGSVSGASKKDMDYAMGDQLEEFIEYNDQYSTVNLTGEQLINNASDDKANKPNILTAGEEILLEDIRLKKSDKQITKSKDYDKSTFINYLQKVAPDIEIKKKATKLQLIGIIRNQIEK